MTMFGFNLVYHGYFVYFSSWEHISFIPFGSVFQSDVRYLAPAVLVILSSRSTHVNRGFSSNNGKQPLVVSRSAFRSISSLDTSTQLYSRSQVCEEAKRRQFSDRFSFLEADFALPALSTLQLNSIREAKLVRRQNADNLKRA